jgi:hypothetical protein
VTELAPAAANFVGHVTDAVNMLSLLYAGTPDANASSHLATYLERIEPAIVDAVGRGKAPIWLDAIRRAVMGRKHEIESTSACRFLVAGSVLTSVGPQ